jgi:hypothetical protein
MKRTLIVVPAMVFLLFAVSCFNCNSQNDKGNSKIEKGNIQSDKDTKEAKIIAQNIYSMLKTGYSGLRNLVPVKAGDYRGRDIQFYDSLGTIFKKHGFNYVADIEDKTAAKMLAQLHTYTRIMLSADRTIVASFVDATPEDTLKKAGDGQYKVYTLESEFNDSVFILSTTDRPSLLVALPDKIFMVFIPKDVSVDSALTIHREYVANFLKNKSDAKLIAHSGVNGIIASQNRQQQLRNNFRQKLGYSLTKEEFDMFLGSCPKPLAEKIRKECALLSKTSQ